MQKGCPYIYLHIIPCFTKRPPYPSYRKSMLFLKKRKKKHASKTGRHLHCGQREAARVPDRTRRQDGRGETARTWPVTSIHRRMMMMRERVVRRPASRPAGGAFTRVGASACMPRGGGGGGVPSRHASGPAISWQACIIVQAEAAVSSEIALHADRRKQRLASGLAYYTCRQEKHAGACRMVIADRAASCKQRQGKSTSRSRWWYGSRGYVQKPRLAASARTHASTGVAASAPASACARRQQLALLQAERDSAWAIGGVVESRPRPEPLTDPALLVLASLVATPAGIARPAFPLQYCRVRCRCNPNPPGGGSSDSSSGHALLLAAGYTMPTSPI